MTLPDPCGDEVKCRLKGNVKQVKEKGRPAPWLTDRVKNLMGQRDAARRKAIKTKDMKDWECYRSLRNQTTSMIKKAKKTHFESAITDAAEDPSLMWKIINSFTGKTKSKCQVQKIRRSDESCTSEPAEMAEEFNNYFSSCAADLARDIPVSEEDPLRHVPESTSTFRLRPVEETEVLNELLRLKPKKATGVDKIPSRLLKDSAPIIVKPLAHIFNLSIASGEVPDDWKLAKISPIHKSGNRDSVSNYRPVSVLNVASKVMEKMVHNQVSHFVNSTGQLTAHQSGFRKHHSTGTAVQKVVEDIQSAQNNKKVTVALFLDLRKAFDTVNHQILLGKLQKMGFDNGATKWFRSYLTDRFQHVDIQNQQSTRKRVTCGVPQGSVLEAGMVPLAERVKLNTLVTVHKAVRHKAPAYMTHMFKWLSPPVLRVRTRTATKQLYSFDPHMLDTPKAHVESFKGSLQYQGPCSPVELSCC
ncbi:hypothetical protein Bbelb_430920 [Branchiostoma belcheri]|nr:hypothetical protein Bbelb_430920 [Branchiostoma belcheri]